jgi:hypothetical protein
MHLNNGLDIPPRNRDILETSILEILRTYNASMWLAGPGNGEKNYKDTLVATPLALVNDPIGYVEDVSSSTQSENLWCNSTWTGAPAPATPTNLVRTASPTNGITTAIIAKGTDEFGSYIDIQWTGTCVTGTVYAQLYSNPTVACNPGDVISLRTRHQIISGTVPPNLAITVHARDAADVFLAPAAASYPSLALKEEDSSSIVPALTAKVYCTILNTINVGVTVDCVLRVWYVQVNKGRAQPHLPTTGTLIQRADTFIPLVQTTTGFKPSLTGNYLSYAKASHTLSNWTITGSSVLTLDEEKNLAGDVLATTLKRTSSISSLVSATITKPLIAILPFSVAFLVKCTKGRYLALRAQGAYPARSDIVFDFLTGNVSVFLEAAGVTETSSRMTRVSPDYWLCQAIFLLDGHSSASVYLSVRSYIAQVDAIDVGPDWAEVAIDSHAVAFVDTYIEPPFPVIPGIVPQYSKNGPFSWKFDGVDDRLAVIKPTIPNGAVSHFRIIALKMPPTAPGTNQVAVSGASAVASVRLAHMTLLSGGFNIDGRWVDGAGATAIPANHTRAANEKLVVRMSHVAGTYTLASKGDIGAAQSTSITPAALAAYTATGERIGCSYATGVDNAFSSWEIYGIISGNGNPTAGEILAMENFLAGHAGFTPLP